MNRQNGEKMYSECSREECLCRSCELNWRNSNKSTGSCMGCIDCDAEADSFVCTQCSAYEEESEDASCN